jgi:hypothetical protein
MGRIFRRCSWAYVSKRKRDKGVSDKWNRTVVLELHFYGVSSNYQGGIERVVTPAFRRQLHTIEDHLEKNLTLRPFPTVEYEIDRSEEDRTVFYAFYVTGTKSNWVARAAELLTQELAKCLSRHMVRNRAGTWRWTNSNTLAAEIMAAVEHEKELGT